MTQPNAEDVPLDTIEEIDEDPPPDDPIVEQDDGKPVDIDTLPHTADTLGRVSVDESIIDIGAMDPGSEPRPPIGGVKPTTTAQQMGFVEPWVRLGPPAPPEAVPKAIPTAEQVEDLKAYFIEQRAALLREVESIEAQLGFIASALDLAVRVARIEAFLGIHP